VSRQSAIGLTTIRVTTINAELAETLRESERQPASRRDAETFVAQPADIADTKVGPRVKRVLRRVL
jgi:hypothetical protein